MKMQPCPHCKGKGTLFVDWANEEICYICEGTGSIPDEPVSHCQACGEPVELGLEWCQHHRPAADLWQALNTSNSHSEPDHPKS